MDEAPSPQTIHRGGDLEEMSLTSSASPIGAVTTSSGAVPSILHVSTDDDIILSRLIREETSSRLWVVDAARSGALRMWRQMLEGKVDVNSFSKQAIRQVQSFYARESSEREKEVRLEWRARIAFYERYEVALGEVMYRATCLFQERSTRAALDRMQWDQRCGQYRVWLVAAEALERSRIIVTDEAAAWHHLTIEQWSTDASIIALPLAEAEGRSSIEREREAACYATFEDGWMAMCQLHASFMMQRDALDEIETARRSCMHVEEEGDRAQLHEQELCEHHVAGIVQSVALPELRERKRLAEIGIVLLRTANFESACADSMASIMREERHEWHHYSTAFVQHFTILQREASGRACIVADSVSCAMCVAWSLWAGAAASLHARGIGVIARLSSCVLLEDVERHQMHEPLEVLERNECRARFCFQREAFDGLSKLGQRRRTGIAEVGEVRARRLHGEQWEYESLLLQLEWGLAVCAAIVPEEEQARSELFHRLHVAKEVDALAARESHGRLNLEETCGRGLIEATSACMQARTKSEALLGVLQLKEVAERQQLLHDEHVFGHCLWTVGQEEQRRLSIEQTRCGVLVDSVQSLARDFLQFAEDVEWHAFQESVERHALRISQMCEWLHVRREYVVQVAEPWGREHIHQLAAGGDFYARGRAATAQMRLFDPLWEAQRRFRRQVETNERNQRLDVLRSLGGEGGTAHGNLTGSTQKKLYEEWVDSVLLRPSSGWSPRPPSKKRADLEGIPPGAVMGDASPQRSPAVRRRIVF